MSSEYLDLDDLLAAAAAYLGRPPQVRDYGLLESALARPPTSVFGQDAYQTIHEKAAALLESLVKNRALVDGNKRLGWVAMRLFYGYNGYTIAASEDEKFELVIAVATGELDTVAKIAHRLVDMARRST
ncbi:death-on-curing protein [Mycobacterium sp. 852002-51163_SCH5372311]|uniref:type II toxin-antitoxin system death-on-curing family toxin n=1 Tax=Mycobacterium sp. 852002-51163_SCH5372311 TaxID=1834097 RepID=UPI0007FE4E4F|nr:type II toxin-antitoxin system death-on-curing family toxin [Mycobacterium sp. 852002-51163_SCH5372311]OBF86179.1 death-on-curing protein [Mycobacterium sp. 852002-51163_SCH5372311]